MNSDELISEIRLMLKNSREQHRIRLEEYRRNDGSAYSWTAYWDGHADGLGEVLAFLQGEER